MMSADTLPTASELRSALEMIDSAVLSDTLAHEPRPLLALAQGATASGGRRCSPPWSPGCARWAATAGGG
jgi:hypothetical protein